MTQTIRKPTKAERDAITALDALNDRSGLHPGNLDPEVAHGKADEIILAALHPDVEAAYARVQERCRWWAYA